MHMDRAQLRDDFLYDIAGHVPHQIEPVRTDVGHGS
jgi:hypothetical protein